MTSVFYDLKYVLVCVCVFYFPGIGSFPESVLMIDDMIIFSSGQQFKLLTALKILGSILTS